MTEKEYRLVCLLIDKNTAVYQPNYCDVVRHNMSEQSIKQLKQDLKVLIDVDVEE